MTNVQLLRILFIAFVFMLLPLGGCRRSDQNQPETGAKTAYPTPETKEAELRREKIAREAAENSAKNEKIAREAAETAAKEADSLRSRWQLAFFGVVSALAATTIVILVKRSYSNRTGPSSTLISVGSSNLDSQRKDNFPGSDVSEPNLDAVREIPAETSSKIVAIFSPQRNQIQYIIDGSNVAKSYHHDHLFRIETLVTLCLNLSEKNIGFICVFDANAGHVARETNDPIQYEVYMKLVSEYPHCFAEITGGMQADDFILLRANTTGANVISNDRFTKAKDNYVQRYPWILDSRRLIKGRVIGGHLSVPVLEIDVPVEVNLQASAGALYKTLNDEKVA